MRILVRLVLLLGIFSSAPAWADNLPLTPLAGGNRSPLAALYALPTRPADPPPAPGSWHCSLDISLANSYLDAAGDSSTLLLDGESWRSELRIAYAPGARLAFSLTLPYVRHSRGSLDSFIEDWHDTFGLPQGGREEAPRNRLLYRYRENGVDLVLLDENVQGLGDVIFGASLTPPDAAGTVLRVALKVPTGDPDRLLGSGATDLSLWLTRRGRSDSGWGPVALAGSFGGSWLGTGKVLPSRQRRGVVFGRLDGGWQPLSWLTTHLSLEGHSPFYHGTGLQELDDFALILSGGFGLLPADGWKVELALSEDLSVGASPDVVFQLNLRAFF